MHLLWNIGGLLTTCATFGCIFWLLSTPPYEEVWFVFCFWLGFLVSYSLLNFHFSFGQQKRVALLMATAAFQGATVGPLIDLAIEIDPRYFVIYFLLSTVMMDFRSWVYIRLDSDLYSCASSFWLWY